MSNEAWQVSSVLPTSTTTDQEGTSDCSTAEIQQSAVEKRLTANAARLGNAARQAKAAQRAVEEAQLTKTNKLGADRIHLAEEFRHATETVRRAAEEAKFVGEILRVKEMFSYSKPFSHFSLALPAEQRTVDRATYALDLLSSLVPSRIANEEIGDALEIIHQLTKAGRPMLSVYLRVATTFFWVLVHSLLFHAERVLGALKAATSENDGKVRE
jgi:hypothetical protein